MPLMFAALSAALFMLLNQFRPDWMGDQTHYLLCIIMVGCLFPGWKWVTSKKREDIPFAAAVGAFNFIWYGWACYSEADLYATVTVQDLSFDTVVLYALALGMLVFGWRLANLKTRGNPSRGTVGSLSRVRALQIHGTLFFGGLVLLRGLGFYSFIPGAILQLVGYLDIGTTVVSVSALLHFRSPVIKIVILTLLGISLIHDLNSGAIYHLGVRVTLIGITLSALTRNLASIFLTVIIAFGALAGLQSVKHQFRSHEAWQQQDALSEVDKLQLWKEGLDQRFADEDFGRDTAITQASARASAIALLELTRRFVPDIVPYREGETLLPVLVAFIPRAIWPDKPLSSFANAFGRDFGVIGLDDYSTAINVPWIVDWYWNFGLYGVIWGMLMTGLLLGGLDRIYNGSNLHLFDLAVGLSVIWPRLVIQESNWAMSFGGLPLMIAFYAVLRRWYLPKPRAVEPDVLEGVQMPDSHVTLRG